MNQKLINDLREGRIVLKNEPKNPEAVREIIKAAWPSCRKPATGCACFYYRDTTGLKKWVSRGGGCSLLPDLPQVPIADFLRPEPRFKVGDLVFVDGVKIPATITDVTWYVEDGYFVYYIGYNGYSEEHLTPVQEFKPGDWVFIEEPISGCMAAKGEIGFIVNKDLKADSGLLRNASYKVNTGGKVWAISGKIRKATNDEIKRATNGDVIESATKTGTEQQFEIGKEYEFSDDEESWYKGKLLAIVDHKDKYIAGFEDLATGYTYIRPIQPKEITKEDLAGLLRDWFELHEENAFGYEPKYLETVCNLVANTGTILEQLTQTKES